MRLAAIAGALGLALLAAPARAGEGAWTSEQASVDPSYGGVFAWDAKAGLARFVGCSYAACSGFERGANGWGPRGASGAPPRRSGFAGAFDDTRGVFVLFAGSAGPAYLAEVWELRGDAWSKSAAAGPHGRYAPSMAYDAAHGVVLMFGGSGIYPDPLAFADTWTYDGAWHEQKPAKSPPGRSAAALVACPDEGGVCLLGGQGAKGPLSDAWVWDGSSWRELATPHPIEPGLAVAAAWDEGRRRVVAVVKDVGGQVSDPNETYELHGGDWHRIAGTTPAFPFDSLSLAYDPQRGRVFGGDALEATIWSYAGTLDRGAACGLGVGCGSGHCASGVCCDSACEGSCATCVHADGATVDGTCGVRARGAEGSPSCAPYVCDGAAPACPSSCAADDDCGASARCAAGLCVPRGACTADGLSLAAGDRRSCVPYRCREGACLASCSSGADCADGRVCDTNGTCVASPDGGGSGCAHGRSSSPWGAIALATLIGVLAARRRWR